MNRTFASLFAAFALFACLISSASAESAGFPERFAKAFGIQAKAATIRSGGQTMSSPYGGTYTIDYGSWVGNSGTVSVTYNNFALPMGWIFNGNWTYTGSISDSGYLDGRLVGSWQIAGLDLGYAGVSNPTYGFDMSFGNGMASGNMAFSMNLYGQTYQQSVPLSFSQAEFVGYLL